MTAPKPAPFFLDATFGPPIHDLLAALVGTRCASAIVQRAESKDALVTGLTLQQLLTEDPEALVYHTGIRKREAEMLTAAVELGRRVVAASVSRTPLDLDEPTAAARFLLPLLAGLSQERIGAIATTVRRTVISAKIFSTGADDVFVLDPNEVVRFALHTRAAGVIVFHNHPSGVVDPSPADHVLMATIRERLSVFDVTLLDFLIIGGQGRSFYTMHDKETVTLPEGSTGVPPQRAGLAGC